MSTAAIEATSDPAAAVAAFEAGHVDPARFDHAAHVHVAWCYLQQHDLAEAIRRFTQALRALTAQLGAHGKYHETVTWFFMAVIAERCAVSPDPGWAAFVRRNPDLLGDAGALLARHYSRERLTTPLARRQFLLPDPARPAARTAERSGRS